MLTANFSKKYVKPRDNNWYVLVYVVSGDEIDIEVFKKRQEPFIRNAREGPPCFYTRRYFGENRPLIFNEKNRRYQPEIADLLNWEKYLEKAGFNLWRMLYSMTNDVKWIYNRSVKFEPILKHIDPEYIRKIGYILNKYGFKYEAGFVWKDFLPEKPEEHFDHSDWDEDQDYKTNWSHYNDNLDMDQQSEDFWNQF